MPEFIGITCVTCGVFCAGLAGGPKPGQQPHAVPELCAGHSRQGPQRHLPQPQPESDPRCGGAGQAQRLAADWVGPGPQPAVWQVQQQDRIRQVLLGRHLGFVFWGEWVIFWGAISACARRSNWFSKVLGTEPFHRAVCAAEGAGGFVCFKHLGVGGCGCEHQEV